jgi:hypothetical protein
MAKQQQQEQPADVVYSQLKNQYQNYDGFDTFLLAASEVITAKPSSVKGFIHFLSSRNELTDFTLPTLKRLAAHLNNIAATYLEMENYDAYFMGMMNVARTRAIVRKIESNPNRL